MPSDRGTDDVLDQLQRLAARVAELEDQLAIRDLTSRYNQAFDDMDLDGYVATFTDDAAFVIDGGAPIVGKPAIRAFHVEIGFGKVHSTVDHRIVIDGDRATQTCNLVLGERTPDRAVGSARLDNFGRYQDELVRTPDGWRFARRSWTPDARLAT